MGLIRPPWEGPAALSRRDPLVKGAPVGQSRLSPITTTATSGISSPPDDRHDRLPIRVGQITPRTDHDPQGRIDGFSSSFGIRRAGFCATRYPRIDTNPCLIVRCGNRFESVIAQSETYKYQELTAIKHSSE